MAIVVGFEYQVVTSLAVLQVVRDGLLQVASAPATNSQLRRSGQDKLARLPQFEESTLLHGNTYFR